jgi:hypothetical protein
MQGIFAILSILLKPQTDSPLEKTNKIYILKTDPIYTIQIMTYTQEYRPRFKKDEDKPIQKPTIFGEAKLLIIIFACVFL